MSDQPTIKLTPNLKELVWHLMSLDAVPPGSKNGLSSAVEFILTPGKMSESFRNSIIRARNICMAIRQAGEPNPWKDATDEEIAGEVMRKMKEKRNGG